MTTFWITKYALSDGIQAMEFDKKDIKEDGQISRIDQSPWRHHYYRKNEYHASYAAARNRALQMREAKIASLKKQIAKLEKLEF